jgi:flagellar basal-body M-ring protein/flagellar hook-basal body protein fliF
MVGSRFEKESRMNFSTIKLYWTNILLRWSEFKPIQKIALATVILLVPISILLALMTTSSTNYVVLFSAEQMRSTDIAKVKSYLDSSKIPYKINENNLLLVPKTDEQQTRLDLALYGLPKITTDKGYELFDSTTWIKGEKELQILELRALKGQLEQDISHFENVRQANIIIDIPTSRTFGGGAYKTKASVILDLVPGARLSQQELRAITYHVSGAVRGLTPNMIAISDTTGRLYQGLDYDGTEDSIRSAEISAEDYLKAKIDGMLSIVLGFDNFYTTVQVSMSRDRITEERLVYSGTVDGIPLGQPVINSISKTNEQQAKLQNPLNSNLLQKQAVAEQSGLQQNEQLAVPMDHVKITSTPGKIRSVSIGVLIDDRILNPEVFSYHGQFITYGRPKEELKRDIENQLNTILKGYKVDLNQAVDFISFERMPKPAVSVEPTVSIPESTTNTMLIVIITITVVGILIMLFRLQRPRYIPSLSERESYVKKAEKKSLANLEEMLDAIRGRFQSNPNSIIGTLRGWMREDKT